MKKHLDEAVRDMDALRAVTRAALALSRAGLEEGDLAAVLSDIIAVIDGEAARAQRTLYAAADDVEREEMRAKRA